MYLTHFWIPHAFISLWCARDTQKSEKALFWTHATDTISEPEKDFFFFFWGGVSHNCALALSKRLSKNLNLYTTWGLFYCQKAHIFAQACDSVAWTNLLISFFLISWQCRCKTNQTRDTPIANTCLQHIISYACDEEPKQHLRETSCFNRQQGLTWGSWGMQNHWFSLKYVNSGVPFYR